MFASRLGCRNHQLMPYPDKEKMTFLSWRYSREAVRNSSNNLSVSVFQCLLLGYRGCRNHKLMPKEPQESRSPLHKLETLSRQGEGDLPFMEIFQRGSRQRNSSSSLSVSGFQCLFRGYRGCRNHQLMPKEPQEPRNPLHKL